MTGTELSRQAALEGAALQKERVPCPLCGGTELELVARGDRYDMGLRTEACLACGFMFTNPRPTREALVELYSRWYRPLYGHEVTPTEAGLERRGLALRAAHTLGVLKRFGLARARSLLEMGCGYGCLLRAAREAHPQLTLVGVEVDAAYAAFARRQARCEVVPDLAELGRPPFDLAVMVHALEHFPDPVETLERVRARLGPEGLLYVDVPDARRYTGPRDFHLAHLSHFTLETLVVAARKAGFEPVLLEAHDPPANVPSIHGVFRQGGSPDARGSLAQIETAGDDPCCGPQEFFAWLARQACTKPWVVVGKGPTFSRRAEVNLSGYHLLGLNHVCREVPVDLAHAIDLDVVEGLGEGLLERARALVMPWRPHVAFKPSELTLADAVERLPVLRRLAEAGRLLWYNCSTAPEPRWGSPIVRVCYFSGEAGVRLLAMAGVRKVRTLGIDGGTGYAGEFRDLRPLTNGVASFDSQTVAIRATVEEFGLDFAPLLPPEPEIEAGASQVPQELAGELGARALVVSGDAWPAAQVADERPREVVVCLGSPADHQEPVRLVKALYGALAPAGRVYVCIGRAPAGSDWVRPEQRLQACRWFLSEGFALEEERTLRDGRTLLVGRKRAAPSPAWSVSDQPPRITIISVVFNSCEEVMDLVGAIRGFTRLPYALTLVDNASQDGVLAFLRRLARESGVQLIENGENLRCAAATNAALRACSTEYVVSLCPAHALVLGEGWERSLIEYMDQRPELGIAGDTWYPRMRLKSARYALGWDPDQLPAEELQHVQGGAWIGRRGLFDRAGFFAEEAYPQGGMDVELSFRLLSLGERLGRCPVVACPPWPERAVPRPGGAVIHPAHAEDRERLRTCLWRCEIVLLPEMADLEARLSPQCGRLLFCVGGTQTVADRTYAERLAYGLASRGREVVLARPSREDRRDAGFEPGRPLVIELGLDPLDGTTGFEKAPALEAALDQAVTALGPFDAVFGEGGLGALVSQPIAQRRSVPFLLVLDRSEVERRENRLTREQLDLARAEHWGADRARAVLVSTVGSGGPAALFYGARQVWVVAPPGSLEKEAE